MKSDSYSCPKCTFAGLDSDTKKFSNDIMQKFPKGFAAENHVKSTTKSGDNITTVVTDKSGKPEFNKILRCPVCGHKEMSN